MALTIGDLVGRITADDSGMRRGLANAQLRMRSFQRDTESRLRDLHDNWRQHARNLGSSFGSVLQRLRPVGDGLRRIGGMAASLGGVAGSVGMIAAKLGAAVPLAAGLATAVANIAPAAGVAVTGLFAIQLATNAVKIGMVGVSDAVSAALDPEKAEEFEEALKKLSPEAQKFARGVKALAPEFKKLQQDVQNRLFEGLDGVLKEMGKTTLPVLRNGLVNAAGAMNLMAKNVGNSAIGLSKSGTLGRAISGANSGLYNLSRIPGQIVVGLTQIGAAAAPAFARLTKGAGEAFDRMSERFSAAFHDGRVEAAIEQAIDLIGQLAEVASNVFGIFASVFKAAQTSGGGMIGVLQEITGALNEAFASPEIQGGLKAIFKTMAQLAKTAAPLLIDALKVIAPIFEELGPPIQTLIRALGDALSPIIKALGPVLKAAARAFGALIEAVAPLLPVFGDLIAALLPALTPLFDALQKVFKALAPVIQTVADTLGRVLTPIIEALTPIIEPLADLIADQLVFWLGFLGDLLVELSPSLEELAQVFADLLIELAPVIEALAELAIQLLEELAPYLPGLIRLIGDLAAVLAYSLGGFIKGVVIPALRILTSLLRGDFSGALEHAKDMAGNMVETVVRRVTELPGKAKAALLNFGGVLSERVSSAGRAMVDAINRKIGDAVERVRSLPGKARAALGGLGNVLLRAGWDLIGGFISGIQQRIPSVRSILGGLTSSLTAWKGPESLDKKILTPAGQHVIAGFMRGIQSQIPALRAQLQGVTGQLPGMALAGGPAYPAVQQRVVLDVRGGSDDLIGVIQKWVQNRAGGDVQVLGG